MAQIDGNCMAPSSNAWNAKRQKSTRKQLCKDKQEGCATWASQGACIANADFMRETCPLSCGHCGTKSPQYQAPATVQRREVQVGADLGVPQVLERGDYPDVIMAEVDQMLQQARTYLDRKVRNVMDFAVLQICKNHHELCAIWALEGECQRNSNCKFFPVHILLQSFSRCNWCHLPFSSCSQPCFDSIDMKTNCAPVCRSCEFLTIEGRCPLDPNATDAWGPGDLNELFSKLTNEPYRIDYSVEILSSPTTTNGGPWVITMENVVSDLESEHMIELGSAMGYETSVEITTLSPDGTAPSRVSARRTSTNAWCMGDCYDDEVSKRIIQRLSNLTGIPEANSEYLQLLKYERGQYYKSHHDYIHHELRRQQGVRILTVLLYLNDVPAGGGTNFPQLGITVLPKRGRALIWPSVLDDRPNAVDTRTTHQALAVNEGIKYAANTWFHMRDFKTPNANEC